MTFRLPKLWIALVTLPMTLSAETYQVGPGLSHTSLVSIAPTLLPGDTVIVADGEYNQRENISDLNGDLFHPIVIMAETRGGVTYRGGTEAWHFSDCSYLKISGFVFTGQSGNGVNFDDGGTFDTPAHHIIIEHCTFRDMNASGNNDLLKLSGLDDFRISFCSFINGADGGSGIDMVGCHRGKIQGNCFENMGSNGIQAKGGTQYITIEQNDFIHAGRRSVNLGGSTGLPFFRPQDAPFEAADLLVRANTFLGSDAPIAFVGSTRVLVENNTIVYPEVWIYRILQENVDARFIQCGDNIMRNNLVYVDDRLRRDFNIGSNTRPETFLFENNLWYNEDDMNWGGPDNPGTEPIAITDIDPQLIDILSGNYHVQNRSIAIGQGKAHTHPYFDRTGQRYGERPTIGAFEGGQPARASFAPVGAEWYYDEPWAPRRYLGYYRLEVIKDTIIDLKTAQVVDYYSGEKDGEVHYPEARLLIASEGPEVCFYHGDDYEHLYTFSEDENPQEGFTVSNGFHNAHPVWDESTARFTFSLERTGVVTTTGFPAGEILNTYTPTILESESDKEITYGSELIERIGPRDQGLPAHHGPYITFGRYGQLRCYSDYEIYYNARDENCDSVLTSTAIDPKIAEGLKVIYSLPGKMLTVTHDMDIEISMFSVSGIRMLNRSMPQGEHEIDLSNWPDGAYTYLILNDHGVPLQRGQLVHQR